MCELTSLAITRRPINKVDTLLAAADGLRL